MWQISKLLTLFQSRLSEQPNFRAVLNLKNWWGSLACSEASGRFEKWPWCSWLERGGCWPVWDEEGMLLCLQAFFFHPLPFWVCIFCSLYHWGTLKYHHVFFCLSGLDGRRVTRVDQMQRYLAQGPRRPSHSFPTAVTNSKWQPQKNIPCGVSSRSFLDCMIIRSDQMVMSPGMLSEWMLFNHSCWASSF